MRTVVLGERPAELDALIARRRACGQDTHDELWDGEYHMAPMAHGRHGRLEVELVKALDGLAQTKGLFVTTAVNLGEETDYRVPDLAVHRTSPELLWFPTAAMVVEVLSPHDEAWQKFDHYARHHVDEYLIADPDDGALHLFRLREGRFVATDRSELLGVAVAELAEVLAWLPR